MTIPFIWLHIKKAGGQSVRAALGDVYKQTARQEVRPFIMLPKDEWNDNLNNYRVSLAEYDYRRMLFAKRYLYPDDFEVRFKFAIVRNPYSRAVSCWQYLTKTSKPVWRSLLRGKSISPTRFCERMSFAYFLEQLPHYWKNPNQNRHWATHTAPMWTDLTDNDGNLLVDFVGKLETIDDDFMTIVERLGIEDKKFPHRNSNRPTDDYRKHYNRKTRTLVETYYGEDIANFGYEF